MTTRTTRDFRFLKMLLRLQVFMLRRGMMGKASDALMVITTTGRKTGRQHSTPIGYLQDGDMFIAINPQGRSNWYKNVLANPAVTLNIKGRDIPAEGAQFTDEAEIARLFDLYRTQQPTTFPRLFGVPVNAPADALQRARETRRFVRFQPED
jgi:deazaflavin-dependent oxidoreductase (nitroreductase family)